jgi:hypothetical protein
VDKKELTPPEEAGRTQEGFYRAVFEAAGKIMRQLNLRKRTDLVKYAIHQGYAPPAASCPPLSSPVPMSILPHLFFYVNLLTFMEICKLFKF